MLIGIQAGDAYVQFDPTKPLHFFIEEGDNETLGSHYRLCLDYENGHEVVTLYEGHYPACSSLLSKLASELGRWAGEVFQISELHKSEG